MSKIITSPVKRFPGTVTIADPLTYPQYFAFTEAMRTVTKDDDIAHQEAMALPGILKCVEAWDIPVALPVTVDNFPSTPRQSVNRLLGWLIGEITRLIYEADDPNA
jgi:hypothetical protein